MGGTFAKITPLNNAAGLNLNFPLIYAAVERNPFVKFALGVDAFVGLIKDAWDFTQNAGILYDKCIKSNPMLAMLLYFVYLLWYMVVGTLSLLFKLNPLGAVVMYLLEDAIEEFKASVARKVLGWC